MANQEWRQFVKSNYKVLTVEHMAYLLGVTRTEILQEFPHLRAYTPVKSIQSLVIVRPRRG